MMDKKKAAGYAIRMKDYSMYGKPRAQFLKIDFVPNGHQDDSYTSNVFRATLFRDERETESYLSEIDKDMFADLGMSGFEVVAVRMEATIED